MSSSRVSDANGPRGDGTLISDRIRRFCIDLKMDDFMSCHQPLAISSRYRLKSQ